MLNQRVGFNFSVKQKWQFGYPKLLTCVSSGAGIDDAAVAPMLNEHQYGILLVVNRVGNRVDFRIVRITQISCYVDSNRIAGINVGSHSHIYIVASPGGKRYPVLCTIDCYPYAGLSASVSLR